MRQAKLSDSLQEEGVPLSEFRRFPLQVLSKNRRQPVDFHSHDVFEFEAVISGSVWLGTNGRSHRAGAGDSWFGSPTQSHSLRPVPEVYLYSVKFSPSLVLSMGDYATRLLDPFVRGVVGSALPLRFSRLDREQVIGLLGMLKGEKLRRETDWTEISKALFSALLQIIYRNWFDAMVRLGQRPSVSRQSLPYEVLMFLDANHPEPLDMASVAGKFELSPSRLRAIFRDHFGQSMKSYLTLRRILHARELLANGVTVTETALACGWSEVSLFQKAFRKEMGIPPSKYGRKVLNGTRERRNG